MKKIAMIGTAPSTRGQAPFAAEDWEIWGQADFWADMPRISRWYEFAAMDKLRSEFPKYLEWLRKAPFPVFMREKFAEVPASVPFDFDRMCEEFDAENMTATVVWMMGHAITEHVEGNEVGVIGLWGYDMALDGEYHSQRPGIRFMEWYCRKHLPALGKPPITVLIPKGSDLSLRPIPYPFADDDPEVAKIRTRKKDIMSRIAGTTNEAARLQAKVDEMRSSIHYLRGALEDVNYWERTKCGARYPAA